MKSIFPLLLVSAVFVTTIHCKNKKKSDETSFSTLAKDTITPVTPSYNLSKPVTLEMHKRLKEISGINWIVNKTMVAEEDETGTIYIVNLNSGKIETSYDFGPNADYEDIVTLRDNYYLLNSNGDIYKVDRKAPNATTTKAFSFGKTDTEFESLYLDADSKRLVMICKNCGGNENNSVIDAYSFDLEKQKYSSSPIYSIEEKPVRKLLNIGKVKFKPSAAAIHPIEKKLYILCSVGRLLLVCNIQGVVEKGFTLDPVIYPQPEGLTFAPNGDMYISNEARGTKGTRATILKLAYQTK